MHIPDGYLGPATCGATFVAMIPVWVLAVRAAKKRLHSRTVPMLAMLSAVAFLVMMFNWPVPDGTTAHMVGGTLIAILLGPWAAILGITVVLVIQAFFFGDGGILALGANCFTMAFALPMTGYLIYKLMMKLTTKKTAVIHGIAAGISAYIAINVAAVVAAFLFGIQPYINEGFCPFGLELAIPAMLLAHLVTAGPVAGVVTGVVIGYMAKTRAYLLGADYKAITAETSEKPAE